MSYGAQIVGVGSGHPERVVTNVELESFLETSDEWIRTRTGISSRRIADPKKGEATLSLSRKAAENALKQANIKASELDMIIVGTVTPDSVMPTTANRLQTELGATGAFSFDLQAACSGFLYGLSVANQFLITGAARTALVIGAETLSTILDWSDRSTAVLFGDGAGAAVLRRTDDPKHRIVDVRLFSDGNYGDLLSIPHGGSRVPTSSPLFNFKMNRVKMKGGELFKVAVRSMVDASNLILAENNLTVRDVNYFLFHQANIRIIDMCAKSLGIDKSQTWINVDKYGNTSAATLPVCLDEAWRAGAVKPGDLILMTTFGGGLTWGSALIRL